MSNRILVTAGLALALAGFGATVPAHAMSAKAFMKAVDADADKTISKAEVEAYAKKRFAALETDNDKTLSAKELKGRLSAAGMKTADPDNDKAIDETEFVGYVDKLFAEANKKGDDTLDEKELGSPAGRKLIKLLE